MSLQPLPAGPPLAGPFWSLVVPGLLFAVSFLATWLLYRHFARTEERER
jgi:hypothetical protein